MPCRAASHLPRQPDGASALAFSYLRRIEARNEGVVGPEGFEPSTNRL